MDEHRSQIDKIDQEILQLLEKRNKLAKKIGLYKHKHGLRIRDRVREAAQLAGYARKAVQLGLSAAAVVKIFEKIIAKSRETQKEVVTKKKKVTKKNTTSSKKKKTVRKAKKKVTKKKK